MPDSLEGLVADKAPGLTSKVEEALTAEADLVRCLPFRTSSSATPWRVRGVRWSIGAPAAQETAVARVANFEVQSAHEVIAGLDHSLDGDWSDCEERLVRLSATVGARYRRAVLELAANDPSPSPYSPGDVLNYVRTTPGSWHVYGPASELAAVETGGHGQLTDAKDRLKVAGFGALVVSVTASPVVTQLDVPVLAWESPRDRVVRFWVTRRFFVDPGQGTKVFTS